MVSPLAIGAVAALALAAHLSRRPAGSASVDQKAELARLLALVEKYDGADLSGRDGSIFQEELELEGFEVVGSGGSRIVVGLGPHLVAKIEYDAGSSANQAEADAWHNLRQILDGHVVPVVGTKLDDRVLLMERATPLETDRDRRDLKEARRRMPFRFHESEWDFNWGRHGGYVKLLDYVS